MAGLWSCTGGRQVSKNVLMPSKWLTDVYVLVLLLDGYDLGEDMEARCNSIRGEIEGKLKAEEKRKAFSDYKTTMPGGERERMRQEYLNKAGIRKDWVSNKETPY